MLLACLAVYLVNAVHKSVHKLRSLQCIFLPGFACLVCALFVVGVMIVGMLNTLL